MKGLVKQFKKLCPPAMLYFVLSVISFLGILMQNCDDPRKYRVGFYKADIPCHNALFFIAKALYILVWHTLHFQIVWPLCHNQVIIMITIVQH